MVNVEKAVVAKLKKGGSNFEVLVDCDLAVELKEGKDIEMSDVLAVEEIFSDSKKGLKASENQVKQLFNTDNVADAAREIIIDGVVQITAAHKAKLLDEKRKRIINLIHMNGVNPKTKLPYPPTLIESAFREAKINVNEFDSVERQVQAILKKIQAVLPITFETKDISVQVPAKFASKAFPLIKNWGNLVKNEWQSDGSWNGLIEIPAGLQDEFFDKVNALTHGDAVLEIKKAK
jgi:ribosome maturation protein SDO1